jgi:hypothetical protein
MGEVYEPRSGCPINAAIEVFGDRWSLLVLRDIVFGDRRYFRELQAGSQEGIASNILADRLKRLVGLGLLLEQGGPALWQEFMDELRREHLGSESPARSPSVRERLNATYLAAINSS